MNLLQTFLLSPCDDFCLQLDNPDEQAAQVRRELASRQQQLDTGAYKMVRDKPDVTSVK